MGRSVSDAVPLLGLVSAKLGGVDILGRGGELSPLRRCSCKPMNVDRAGRLVQRVIRLDETLAILSGGLVASAAIWAEAHLLLDFVGV